MFIFGARKSKRKCRIYKLKMHFVIGLFLSVSIFNFKSSWSSHNFLKLFFHFFYHMPTKTKSKKAIPFYWLTEKKSLHFTLKSIELSYMFFTLVSFVLLFLPRKVRQYQRISVYILIWLWSLLIESLYNLVVTFLISSSI